LMIISRIGLVLNIVKNHFIVSWEQMKDGDGKFVNVIIVRKMELR